MMMMMMMKQNTMTTTTWMMILIVLIGQITPGLSNVANPMPYDEIQPDGTVITLRLIGNAYSHVETDMKGYTVLRGEDGYYRYAMKGLIGDLLSTDYRVGQVNPDWLVDLVQGIMPDLSTRDCSLLICPTNYDDDSDEAIAARRGRRLATPTIGTLKNLVIPIMFNNHGGRSRPSQGDLDILMNHVGPHDPLAPTGSVRDVFLENSYGKLTLDSVVVPWITSPYTESGVTQGNSGLGTNVWPFLTNALQQLDDSNFDFQQFDIDGDGKIDSITFLHSGYAAEFGGTDSYGTTNANRLWSHKWAMNQNDNPPGFTTHDGITIFNYHISPAVWGISENPNTGINDIGRIGVISHETGHFLGITDLYDTDDSPGRGIGSWGLMANSWGFDGSQLRPPHMSAWSKVKMGWVEAIDVKPGLNHISATSEQNPNHTQVYKVTYDYPTNEYLLIENRQRIGFESDIPQGGLAIWHIDDSTGYNTEGYPGKDIRSGWFWAQTVTYWPETGEHYRIALLQADGNYNLEKGNNGGDNGDLFHGQGKNYIDSTGVSGRQHPNTNGYQGGTIRPTTNRIYSISNSGTDMTFQFSNDDLPSGTPSPTSSPTKAPTKAPTSAPTKTPTTTPTKAPTGTPTASPTKAPTGTPTASPTPAPQVPSSAPSYEPSYSPSSLPSSQPSTSPSMVPSMMPSISSAPSSIPTKAPTGTPTKSPTKAPTGTPTKSPTKAPTESPTKAPTGTPTKSPTRRPTPAPVAPPPTPAPVAPPASCGFFARLFGLC